MVTDMNYGIQTGIMTNIYKLEINYPIVSWIMFYLCALILLFIDFSILDRKKMDILFLIFMIFWLILLTVYKINGCLIYPCLIAYILIFGIIIYKYYIFKKDKIENSYINQKTKISNLSPTKPKKQQKPNEQKEKQKPNFKKYKLIDNSKYKIKNNDKNKSESKK